MTSMEQLSKRLKRIVVGITSRAPEKDIIWLKEFLTGEFRSLISRVRYIPISNNSYWKDDVKECSVVVVYHNNIQQSAKKIKINVEVHEMNYLSKTLGWEKVLVLFDDLDDISEEMRQRILQIQPTLRPACFSVILIPRTDKKKVANGKQNEFFTVLSKGMMTSYQEDSSSSPIAYASATTSRFLAHSEPQPWETPSMNSPSPGLKKQISIFSMSSKDSYTWLVDKMMENIRLKSAEIKCVYINNYHQFHSELTKCQFAILYHSQKQGRVNITNVTDALYNVELRDLSKYLGRNNVIVVIDDMKDISSKEKAQILKKQPDIFTFARDLFLFKEKEKSKENLNTIASLIAQSLRYLPALDYDRNGEHAQANSVTSIGHAIVPIQKPVSPSDPSTHFTGIVYNPNRFVFSEMDLGYSKLNKQAEAPKETILSMEFGEGLQEEEARSQRVFPFAELYKLSTDVSSIQERLEQVQQAVKSITEFLLQQESLPINQDYLKNDTVISPQTSKEKLQKMHIHWGELIDRDIELKAREEEIQKKEKNLVTREMMINKRESEQGHQDQALRERLQKVEEEQQRITKLTRDRDVNRVTNRDNNPRK